MEVTVNQPLIVKLSLLLCNCLSKDISSSNCRGRLIDGTALSFNLGFLESGPEINVRVLRS